jgi:hypothetical protein
MLGSAPKKFAASDGLTSATRTETMYRTTTHIELDDEQGDDNDPYDDDIRS